MEIDGHLFVDGAARSNLVVPGMAGQQRPNPPVYGPGNLYLIDNGKVTDPPQALIRELGKVAATTISVMMAQSMQTALTRSYVGARFLGYTFNMVGIPDGVNVGNDPLAFDPTQMRAAFDAGRALAAKDNPWQSTPTNSGVYLMNVSQGQPRRITHESCFDIFNVSLSPDAGTILYSRRRSSNFDPSEIVSVSSLGGTGRVIVENGLDQEWLPDGQRLGYLHEEGISANRAIHQWWSCRPDGSDRRLEFADTVVISPGLRFAFHYSPDGKSVAWTKTFPEGYSEIMIHDLEHGTDRQLTRDGKFADDPLWSPTGHILYRPTGAETATSGLGQPILVIGFPEGERLGLSGGIVSQLPLSARPTAFPPTGQSTGL